MHPSVRKTRSLSICLIMVLSAFGPIAAPVAADMPLTEPYFDLLMEENGTWEELEPGWMYDLEAGTYDMQIDYYNLDVGLNYTLRWITYGIHADGGGLEGNVTSEDVTDTWQMEVSEFDCWYQAVVEIINTTDGSWDHVYTQWYDFRGECTEYGTVTPSAEINGTWVSEPEELEPGSYNMSWDVTNLTAGEEYKLDYWYYLTRNTWDMSTSTNGYAWNATGSDESIGWNVTVTEFDCTLQPEALLWQNTTTGWTIIDQYWVGSWSEVIFLPCESMITAYIWLDEEGDWVELADQNDNEYWSHHFPDDGSCDEFWDNEGHWWECTDPDTGDVEVFDECYEFYDEQTGEDMLECYINYEPMYLEEGSYNITLEIVGLSVGEDYFLYGDLWESTYWGYESNHYELSFTAPTEEISNTVTLDINAETCSYGYDLSLDHNETSGHSEHLESMSVTVNGPCEQPPSPFTLTYDDVLWEPEWQYEEFDECEEEDGGYECWNNDSWGYQEDVPIAFLYDMSGPVSTYAPGFLSSAEIAIEHLNDNQDIYNFSLEEYDTGCDGNTAAIAAQDAVDDGIELVVGALCSGASMGANAILSSYGIPHISPTSSAPGLSDSSAYPGFFRVIVSDAMDGEALADLVRDSNSSSPAVLYHSDDAFLANVAEILIEDYEAGGGSICADLTVASGETDLSDEAQILTDDSCDSVVMVTYPETAGSMLTELDDDGWSGEMFTGEQVAYELENYMNDPSDADGLQFIERVGGPSDSERAEAFSEDCDNDSSCSAGAIFTYETYDAFSVLAESFLLASAWGMMLEDAIHAVGYGWDGASTVVTFNDDGDVGGNGYDLCDLEYDSSSGSLVSGCDGHWDSPDFYYNANEVIDVYDVINGVSWFEECDDSTGVWICQVWWMAPEIGAGDHDMTWNVTDLGADTQYKVEWNVQTHQNMGTWDYADEEFTFNATGNSQSQDVFELIDWSLETDNSTCGVSINVWLYENESDGSGNWWFSQVAADGFDFKGPCEQPPSPFTLYYDGVEHERVAHNMTGFDWCDEYYEGDGHSWFECYIDYDGDGNWDDIWGFDECSNLSTGWECVERYEDPFLAAGNHSMTLDTGGLETGLNYSVAIHISINTQQGGENEDGFEDFTASSDTYSTSGHIETDNFTCNLNIYVELYENESDGSGGWWHHHIAWDHFNFRGPCEQPPSPFTLYYDGMEYERVAHNMTGLDWCDEYEEGWFECYIDYDGDGNWDDVQGFDECSNLSTGWECVGWYENPDLAAGNHSMTLDTGGLEAGQSYAVEIQAEIWDVMGSWDGDYSTELFNASSDMESLYFSMETDNSTCGAEVYVTLYEVEWDDYGNWWHDQHVFGDGFGFDTPCEQPPSPIHLLYPNETGDIVEWEPVTQINEYDVCYDYGDHFECWDNDDDDHRWENDCYEVAALDDSDSIWQCENAEGSPFIDAGYHGMTWNITDLDESDDYRLQSYIWTMGMLDYEMYEDTLNFTASSDSHDIDWDLYVDNSTCDVQISAQLMRAVDYDDDGVTDWYDYIASNYFGFMGPCVFEGFPVDVGLEVDDGGWQGVVGVPFEVLMNDDDSPDVIMQHLGYSLSAGSWDMKWTLDNLTVGEGYFAYYETDTPNDEGDGGGDVDWNTYDYCEWEGTEDDDDRWWCTYDGTDNDWEDWWFYCEYDEYDEQWWCTDDFGQSPDWEFSANGTEHMGGVDSSVEGFFEFNATSGSEEVIWTLDIEDETCVIAVFLELASNESDMEGFYVGIIAGPAAALDDNSNGVPDCMEEGGIGPDEGPEFEPEDFAVGIGYSAAFLDTDGDTATFYIEYYMVLDDEFRMKVDADFGDGDGFLNQSEADMFAMMATEGGDGEGPPFFCGDGSEIPFEWANDGMEDCADGSDEPQDFDGDGTTDNWFDCHDGSTVSMDRVNDGTQDCPDGEDEGLGGGPDGGDDGPEGMTLNGADPIGNASMGIIFVNLANGSGGSVEIHMGWELYYDVDADAEGEYALSYVGDDEDSDTFPFNTTFCAYTEDSSDEGYTIVSAVVNGTTVTEIDGSMVYDSHCLTMAPYEMLPPFTVTWGLLSSDSDGDGVNDDDDAFPWDPTETTDTDGDGWGDNSDVFPDDPDEWADTDGDGTGDNADTDFDGDGIDDDAEDSDGDGVYDDEDAFPDDANETTDTDGDGVGDNADDFPDDANETTDTDGDGIGDNSDDDADGDGQPNDLDDFPLNGQESSDADGDGVGDNEDVFPDDPAEWADFDSDEIGDNADLDDDNDGTPDTSDDFPLDANETTDTDDDGLGDNADAFPNDPYERFDSDGDGVGDNADDFPSDSSEWSDSDNDGTGDNADVFPNDPNEIVDSDGDGVGDGGDAFPYDSTETKDSDGDGVGDNAQAAQVEPEPEPPEEDDGLFGLPGFSAATSLASMLGAAILIAGRRKD